MSAQLPQQVVIDISVHDLAQRMAQLDDDQSEQDPLQLIDVREPQELGIASVAGFESLPLSRFGEWSSQIAVQLDPHAETIVMCHHGMRSAQMCQWLMNQGFTNVKNLAGGIAEYSRRIDPSIPQY